jgi:AraC family transcriptional regulator of adaptative response/methylated-DNA-[protein]-cysteine methyltransferase
MTAAPQKSRAKAPHAYSFGWTKNAPSKTVEEITYAQGKSSLGTVLVASSAKGVVAVIADETDGDLRQRLHERFPEAKLVSGGKEDARRVAELVRYIRDPKKGLSFALDLRGTPFQRKVWDAVLKIPAGKTSTFTEIARQIGVPRAIRAVGNACSFNNLQMAVPCHRVLRSDGSRLGTYHWGSDRQSALLSREGVPEGEKQPTTAATNKRTGKAGAH